jgi:hypothetical protein
MPLSYLSYAVMDNYKNTPQFLYGLTPSQMDMFVNADNPMHKASGKVTEVLIIYILLILSKSLIYYSKFSY